jgi:hypothetical protein
MDYITYFLEKPDQITVILAVSALWLGLANLGRSFAGPYQAGAGEAVCGWAGVITLFTLVGVFTPVSFTIVAGITAILAVAATVVRWRHDGQLLSSGMLRIAIVATPLILVTSAMVASQWDEFSHWLPSIKFLIESDGFPDVAQPRTGATYPAYPYGLPLLSYLAARMTGGLLESAAPLINVLLLLSFGLMVARIVRQGVKGVTVTGEDTTVLPWGLCALGALAAVPFNPTFAQKVVLTSYADTSSAVALGFAVAFGWMALNAAASEEKSLASWRAWQMGLALTVLVALKQATLVLFILVTGAVAVAALRDPAVGWRRLIRLLPGMMILPLVVYAVWRFHVATQLGQFAEFTLRPLAEWSLSLVPDILTAMLTVLVKKGLYLGLMMIACWFGLRALWRCRTPFDRLALIVGALFAGYNGFLFFTYIAAFGANDALRAASLWRYNMHLGAAGVIFAWFGLSLLWVRWDMGRRLGGSMRYMPALAIVLTLAAPFIFAGKLRFDREPDKPFYRTVAKEMSSLDFGGRSFGILDPLGSGESWVITLFQLGDRVTPVGYLAAFDDTREASFRLFLERQGPDFILVHSVTPALNAALAPMLEGDVKLRAGRPSYLLRRSDTERTWSVVQTWTRPDS